MGSGKLTPPPLDCAFHVVLESNRTVKVFEEYGFQTPDTVILMVEQYKPSSLPRKDYTLFRSDVRDSSRDILFEGYGGDDPLNPKYCQKEYVQFFYAQEQIRPYTEEFEYENDGVDFPCPNSGLVGCKRYCNSHHECVIVDDHGRYVEFADGTIATYKNVVHKEDEFAHDCEGEPLNPPVNPCY